SAQVVVQAPSVRTPAGGAAIRRLERRALATGEMFQPVHVDVNDAGTVAVVNIPVAGDGNDSASNAALNTLRNVLVPATVGELPESASGVTGTTALSRDFNAQFKRRTPLVFA